VFGEGNKCSSHICFRQLMNQLDSTCYKAYSSMLLGFFCDFGFCVKLLFVAYNTNFLCLACEISRLQIPSNIVLSFSIFI